MLLVIPAGAGTSLAIERALSVLQAASLDGQQWPSLSFQECGGRCLRPPSVIAEGPHPLLSRRRILLVRRTRTDRTGARSHIRGSFTCPSWSFPRGILLAIADVGVGSSPRGSSDSGFGHRIGGLWPPLLRPNPNSKRWDRCAYLGSGSTTAIGRVLTVLQSASLPGLSRPFRSFGSVCARLNSAAPIPSAPSLLRRQQMSLAAVLAHVG